MPEEAFNSWGWRIPFLLSVVVIIAGYIIRREVEETPAFAEEGEHGEVPKSPIIEAFRLSWADMLRVVCMALMNVIPVVADDLRRGLRGPAGATGSVSTRTSTCGSRSLGNILAVVVIPYVGNLSDRIGRRPPIIVGALGSGLLSFAYLYAISIHNVSLAIVMSLLDVGRRLPGLQRRLPELLPGAVPDAHPGLGDGHRAEHRDDHHRAASGAVRGGGAARLDQHPAHHRRDHLRRDDHRGGRGHAAPGRPIGST